MTIAGSFDDEYFPNSKAMRAIQEMVRQSTAPAMEAIRQAHAADVAKVMESLKPTIAAITAEATKTISQTVLPAIPMPKFDLSYKSLRQIPLGDDAAKEAVSSVDYNAIAQGVASEVEETESPEDVGTVQPGSFTEQELDQMTADFFKSHPAVAEKFYNDPEISALDPGQKKMLAWQWAVMVLFGIALLVGWAKVDGNVDYVKDVVTDSAIMVIAYNSAKKALGADEDDDADSGNKKEGA
jgi:hypothetical protein